MSLVRICLGTFVAYFAPHISYHKKYVMKCHATSCIPILCSSITTAASQVRTSGCHHQVGFMDIFSCWRRKTAKQQSSNVCNMSISMDRINVGSFNKNHKTGETCRGNKIIVQTQRRKVLLDQQRLLKGVKCEKLPPDSNKAKLTGWENHWMYFDGWPFEQRGLLDQVQIFRGQVKKHVNKHVLLVYQC